jgi:hypothetical protein
VEEEGIVILYCSYSTQRRDTLEGILERQRREVPPIQSAREAASRILSESHYQPKPFRNKTADMLQNMGVGIAETLNRFCIPGYSAYVSGGSIPEVVASAGSDIALTLVRGNAAKMVAGAKTLFKGAKPLLKNTTPQMPLIEKPVLLEKPAMVKHHLFNRFWQQTESSKRYVEFFKAHKIKVDDFCVELPKTTHMNYIHHWQNDWTNRWKSWIDMNPNASTEEVYQFAGRLMDEYGISHVPIVKYHK